VDLAMNARPRWVVYGSSLSAERVRWAPWRACGGAWVAALRALRPDLELVNRSGWGWTSRDAVRAFGPRVLALQPVGVLLEFVINDADVRRHCTNESSAAHLDTLLRALAGANPGSRAAVLIPPRPLGRHARTRPQYSAYADMWRQTAAAHRAAVVDLDAAWTAQFAHDPEGEAARRPDGLHFSAAVAAWIASVVAAALDRLAPRAEGAVAPSASAPTE